MNNIINSSGIYDITSYNLTSNKATIFSTLFVSGVTILNNATTCTSSLNASGITTFNNYTIMNSETQLQPKLLLSGQEFLIPSQTSTDGVALLLGTNRLNSRVLFIGDSAKLTQNATNSILVLNPSGRFDCTSTDGTTR